LDVSLVLNNLQHVIRILADESKYREFYREELPEPQPPREYWNRMTRELRKDYPDWKTVDISREIKRRWYSLPAGDQANWRKGE
jgi:hypothetical protein